MTTLDDLEAHAARPRERFGAEAHIVCDNLVRIYQADGVQVQALQGLDLLVDKGDLVALVGASGSGKSTLLNILAGLDTPTAGAASVAGCDLLTMKARDRLRYRREVAGFVWQQTGRNLFSHLDALDNVMLPMSYAGTRGAAAERRAGELLELLGVGHVLDRHPGMLSGGEQQRVAIAVALANTPDVLFADEPTGELDSVSAQQVFEALRTANRELGVTVLVVTHDAAVAGQVRRTVAIRDGRTSSETVRGISVAGDGSERQIAEEYVMLDRAGRLQLPGEYVQRLALRDRVRVALDEDHVSVWPAAAGPASRPAPDTES
ncbi:ABC transporter ATP-binding protein [Catenulispora pinisilvae]|uniref:ABC transporter ATP-binding protein n=1 Tax=Catenulispora pinisilvae TaxID=2705253 RepID=UPI0018924E83|nr:ABC transporter ATP-binding protein [Catenulispora pinisilvae]